MKKFVFFLTLVPILCFGQDGLNISTKTKYKFSINIEKYHLLDDFTSFPFTENINTMKNGWAIGLSKDLFILNTPFTLSLGYINTISARHQFQHEWREWDFGPLESWGPDGVHPESFEMNYYVNYGFYETSLKSTQINLSYSLTKKEGSRSNVSVFFGLIHRRAKIEIDYNESSAYYSDGGLSEIEQFWLPEEYQWRNDWFTVFDNNYGLQYEYLLITNLSAYIRYESQSNNIVRNEAYDIRYTDTYGNNWAEGLEGDNFLDIVRLVKRPQLMIFGLRYFIR